MKLYQKKNQQLKQCNLKHITIVTRQSVVTQTYVFCRLDHLISQPTSAIVYIGCNPYIKKQTETWKLFIWFLMVLRKFRLQILSLNSCRALLGSPSLLKFFSVWFLLFYRTAGVFFTPVQHSLWQKLSEFIHVSILTNAKLFFYFYNVADWSKNMDES